MKNCPAGVVLWKDTVAGKKVENLKSEKELQVFFYVNTDIGFLVEDTFLPFSSLKTIQNYTDPMDRDCQMFLFIF